MPPKISREPIAITGIGCRFPTVADPKEFWNLLEHGIDAISAVPPERWDETRFYHPDPSTPGKTNSRCGGFLKDVDQFDPSFFGISPREASRMDPQQRLILEVSWEALEDAGEVLDRLSGSPTGVFIGVTNVDYGRLLLSQYKTIDAYTGTGASPGINANRVSYFLNLKGPSMIVDTSCSSSLVAVHLACKHIWDGECSLALAGGVNLILSPSTNILFTKMGGLSPDGRCKAFDSSANGYVRGEGVGVVVLKPLSRALAEGNLIYALIRNTAVNQDGRTNGLTAPNGSSQEAVLRQAYRGAGIVPGKVQYIEAHGTGTPLGDPIEALALGAVLKEGRSPGQKCAIGSVKTNFGHLEGAAGIAGLIKVALSMTNGVIPASLHYREPNPHIPFDRLPIRVQKRPGSWPGKGQKRIAGVSSFGFGGTNCHIVLASVNQPRKTRRTNNRRGLCLPLSAKSAESLQELARKYLEYLETKDGQRASLIDICGTASVYRTHHDYRAALCFTNRHELKTRLKTSFQNDSIEWVRVGRRLPGKRHKIAFVFSGQGSQWLGMGNELMSKEPIFARMMRKCARLIHQTAGWSLESVIRSANRADTLSDPEISQPGIFAIQMSLVALLESWNIRPESVVGHSAGEIAAACAAGALSLEEGVRIICQRSRLLKRLSGKGKMALVALPPGEVLEIRKNYCDRLHIAAYNGPTATVVAGDGDAIEKLLKDLEASGTYCRLIKAEGAGHSPQTAPLAEELRRCIGNPGRLRPQIPYYSTVTGSLWNRGLGPSYWSDNMRNPVQFAGAIQRMAADGFTLFVEVAPHPILNMNISEILTRSGLEGAAIPTLQRSELDSLSLANTVGALYSEGYDLDWRKINPDVRLTRLPTYAWQHSRHWSNLNSQEETPLASGTGHPMLGPRTSSPAHPGEYAWQVTLSRADFPFLNDHGAQGNVILPGAAYIEMALAAATDLFGSKEFLLKNVEFSRALYFLDVDTKRTLTLVFNPLSEGGFLFRFYSNPDSSSGSAGHWNIHASGTISVCQEPRPGRPPDIETVKRTLGDPMDRKECYERFKSTGADYGPAHQGISRVWYKAEEALGEISTPGSIQHELVHYQFHPALLDSCFQALGISLPFPNSPFLDKDSPQKDVFLPVRIKELRVWNRSCLPVWSHARYRRDASPDGDNTKGGDIEILDERGNVLASVYGMVVKRVGQGDNADILTSLADWFYEISWTPSPEPIISPKLTGTRWIIFLDEKGIGSELATLMRQNGAYCTLVNPSHEFAKNSENHYTVRPGNRGDIENLLKSWIDLGNPGCDGIIHLWSLNASKEESLAALRHAQIIGSGSVLHLVQELSHKRQLTPRLFLVTEGAQAVGGQPLKLNVPQSPLWGLGRSVAQEHNEYWGGLVDLDPDSSTDSAVQQIFTEINRRDSEDQVAYRRGVRHVARLVRVKELGAHLDNLTIRDDAAYLITGGLGDIGLETARWLARNGAKTLVLWGRSKLPPRNEWAHIDGNPRMARAVSIISEIEKTGTKVYVATIDVANERSAHDFLKDWKAAARPAIRGVIHSAGIAHPKPTAELDLEAFSTVTSPKIDGSWILHQLFKDSTLDFFILFSSVASLLGWLSQGLAHYAAANAFLDALAHFRRQLGLPALSINWGGWSEVGMAARFQLFDRYALRGTGGISSSNGTAILGRLLSLTRSQVAVAPINWDQWSEAHPFARVSPLLSNILSESPAGQSGTSRITRETILAVEPALRKELIESYLKPKIARVLGLSDAALDTAQPLTSLGLDSLVVIELKNRVKLDLGIEIPLMTLLSGLSIRQLASWLAQELDSQSAPTKDAPPSGGLTRLLGNGKAGELSGRVESLSDDEVDILLRCIVAQGIPGE
ncbi:MAG: type I polyketide synthase [Elusimicrobia bacterium]|nr:type I polyketide synthase [Elusimicrobiota bacterium]